MLAQLTAINAIFYVCAVAALLYVRRRRQSSAWVPMLLWFGHCALYWVTIAIVRALFGYTGPSQIVSTWGAIVQMQAAITVVAVTVGEYLLKRWTDAP